MYLVSWKRILYGELHTLRVQATSALQLAFVFNQQQHLPSLASLRQVLAVHFSKLLSSSFLLMTIHACIPAFAWPFTERPKMWAAALEVQQPLRTTLLRRASRDSCLTV